MGAGAGSAEPDDWTPAPMPIPHSEHMCNTRDESRCSATVALGYKEVLFAKAGAGHAA